MSDWPPTRAQLLEHQQDVLFSAYSQKIWTELMEHEHFRSLSERARLELRNAVVEINSYAGAAASRLQSSPFTEEQRRFFAPPQGAGFGPKYKAWKRNHEDQACIDAARRSRLAILQGEWPAAISYALTVGARAHGHLAVVARPVLEHTTKKGSTRPPDEKLVQRDRAIADEATRIRVKKPDHSDTSVAEIIAKRHEKERGFPNAGTIRKILAKERKLASQASRSPE